MPEGRIRKEGLGLSSYAVPLTRNEVQRTSNEVQLNIQRNLFETISKVWELNPDVHPEIGRLLRTSPEVWKELKTTSGLIPSRNQRGKAAADYVQSRREQDGMSEIGPEEV
ncbi:hypothetical protein EDD22DRAFT_844426 [Suillus occidentalis]|nr:hypothetical protein EDD22DRAFT_844426 [Suillus occidentalis]